MLRRDSPTPREHMSERLWMRDRMTLLHSVCHHHEFVKTSHRGSHETCSPQVLTEPNGDGIGDFPGLMSRLDHITDLGANALWLLPFYPSPLRDDGYDVTDYCG